MAATEKGQEKPPASVESPPQRYSLSQEFSNNNIHTIYIFHFLEVSSIILILKKYIIIL